MIEDRVIDEKINLRDLLAQAVCMGVRAGRGDIDYIGPWHIANDILNETEEIMQHRELILGLRGFAVKIMETYSEGEK